MAAAELLWPHIRRGFTAHFSHDPADDSAADEGLRYRGPFYLLAGLAIENFLKALIVLDKQKRGEPLTDRDKLTLVDGKHDLVSLNGIAGVDVGEIERAMLARLSQFVLWRGRYPVPKRSNLFSDVMTQTSDLRDIQKFVARINAEYQRRVSPR
jgi:hypothetical protein